MVTPRRMIMMTILAMTNDHDHDDNLDHDHDDHDHDDNHDDDHDDQVEIQAGRRRRLLLWAVSRGLVENKSFSLED